MTTEKGTPMPDPQENKLVQALKVDPNNPPDLAVLNGFFGRSVDKANIRLYRSVLMDVWQDIPRNQIIHFDKIERGPETPFGEDIVWMLDQDARALDPQMVVRAVAPPQPEVAPLQPEVAPLQPEVAPLQPEVADDGGDGDGDYSGWRRLWPPR